MFRRLLPIAAMIALAGGQASAQDDDAPRVLHSPWLALRFEQAGQEARISPVGLLETQVALERAPFTIILPVRGESDVYALAGWTDDSIFALAQSDSRAGSERAVGTPFYFAPYTGMADTAAGSGTLMLNLEGHHYLEGLRLGPDRERHVFHISEVMKVGAGAVPIEEFDSPIHLVIWFDENGDDAMGHGEYEFFTLRFSNPSPN